MTFHMGTNEDGNGTRGNMIFGVKTGKQWSHAEA